MENVGAVPPVDISDAHLKKILEKRYEAASSTHAAAQREWDAAKAILDKARTKLEKIPREPEPWPNTLYEDGAGLARLTHDELKRRVAREVVDAEIAEDECNRILKEAAAALAKENELRAKLSEGNVDT
ncbi:hypothetical protein M1L60_31420 [Actinoplanes sp. TRM 88003]|uniref:UVR domain-containing protein n=1 Tax=Paractinoplanes aksuensis TaxID=2939490 RepID=A0ABT1DW71_9ACTN|nr:hypothetical protein [Actinoplanes aksuensis]MCO8275099.1 hypothetical protein [Actinoplanes aksuensis]